MLDALLDAIIDSLKLLPFLFITYLLMELFLNNKNQLFTRSQILNKVWGYDYYGDGRAVDTYIKKLRKKLGVHSHRIQTIMKAGYTYTDEED